MLYEVITGPQITDLIDASVNDKEVADPVKTVRRIDDPSSFQQKILHVVSSSYNFV